MLDESVLSLAGLGQARGLVLPGWRVWRRVPYGEPPTNTNRWRPPVPKIAWSGIVDATNFGCACPQAAGFDPPMHKTSEDCLSMAIYAPRYNASRKVPVIVYIHGGSFASGGAEEDRLNASQLVERSRGGVAVVVVQYRLTILGFLASRLLVGRGGDNSTGNYGVQDQRLALQFVRTHAASFGGDAARVTIAGQSAGAAGVSVHLVASRSAGLFERAAMWSGAFPDWAAASMPMQEKVFSSVLASLCPRERTAEDAVACLERADIDALIAAGSTAECGDSACLQPTVDGVELTAQPRELMEASDLSRIGLLMGSGVDEGDGFDAGSGLDKSANTSALESWLKTEYALNGSEAAHLSSLYLPEARPNRAAGATAAYVAGEWAETDQSMWCSALRTAARHAAASVAARAGSPTPPRSGADKSDGARREERAPAAYLYRFARGVGGAPMVHHSDDIPFWFDARAALAADGAVSADYAVAAAMSAHLVAFAAHGDPAAPPPGGMAPARPWPPFRLSYPASLRIDVKSQVRDGVQAAQCRFWDAHPYYNQESR